MLRKIFSANIKAEAAARRAQRDLGALAQALTARKAETAISLLESARINLETQAKDGVALSVLNEMAPWADPVSLYRAARMVAADSEPGSDAEEKAFELIVDMAAQEAKDNISAVADDLDLIVQNAGEGVLRNRALDVCVRIAQEADGNSLDIAFDILHTAYHFTEEGSARAVCLHAACLDIAIRAFPRYPELFTEIMSYLRDQRLDENLQDKLAEACDLARAYEQTVDECYEGAQPLSPEEFSNREKTMNRPGPAP